MADPKGPARRRASSTGAGEEAVIAAAVTVMARHGYHGASIRDIAKAAHLSTAALYHYFPSKHDILVAFLVRATDRHYERLVSAAEHGADPAERLAAVVRAHVQLHTDLPVESFVGNTELRSVAPKARRIVIEKRDRIQRLFDELVQAGVDAEMFTTPHPKEVSRSIVVIGNAVATWYRKSGPLTPADIADMQVEFAFALAGYVNRNAARVPARG